MKHHIIRQNLKKKGWEHGDIEDAISAFIHAEERKHPLLKRFDRFLVWFFLAAGLLFNAIIIFAFIPAYLVLPELANAILLFILGFLIGAVMDIFIREMEHVTHHHYLVAGLLIPLAVTITIYYTIRLTNTVSYFLPKTRVQDPILLALIYFGGFILPHLIWKYREFERELLM